MIEAAYNRYLELTGDPNAAATLVLAETMQAQRDTTTMTAQDAAKALGVSVGTVYNLCDTGRLKHTKIGRAIRIQPDDLRTIKADSTKGGPFKFKRLKL